MAGLNKEQKEAATYTKGPLLVVAGAGAGKTKTITHRIVNLIKEGVEPSKILAVTFTNKAAKEMREKIMDAINKYNIKLDYALDSSFSGSLSPRARGALTLDPSVCESPRKEKSSASSIPFVSTVHSLGVFIIKENARILGLTKYFTILDDGDTTSMIKDIMKELAIDPKQYDPRRIKNIISREKGNFVHIPEYEERDSGYLGKIISRVWNEYEKRKMKENSLDFDDLLLKAVKLLKENEEIRKIYQERWEYIHVDEYQDTNEVQYLLTKILSEKHKNICVVGDADQNIYSWRGANLKNILNFEKDFPNAKIIMLEENYRSTKNILEAANEIIRKNIYRPDKNLFTKNETGEKISLYEAIDETDEAEFVATKILELLDSAPGSSFSGSLSGLGSPALTLGSSACESPQKEKSGASLENVGKGVLEGTLGSRDGDGQRKFLAENFRGESENTFPEVAVLYRANFQSRALEEAMLRYNIPYQVLGVKFFERKEIKDTLAYLRAALNPESLSDIKRIINFPVRGIGKVTLLKIFAGEKETLPIKMKLKIDNFYNTLTNISEKIKTEKASDVVKFTVKKSGIETELMSGTEEDVERLENIKELATLAIKYDNLENGEGIEKLLEDASLASDQDSIMHSQEKNEQGESLLKKDKNTVKLMTVHASKGLEFENVFITGLEDGLFPHQKQNEAETAEDREEERRLFYVALTRAKKKLYLSFANFRTIFGSRQINAPSEFISDIPKDLLERGDDDPRIKTIYI